MKIKTFRKTLSIIFALSLLVNGFAPFLAAPIYADDSTPSATLTEEVTPSPEPTIEPTPTETPEITPEVTPTPSPVIASDSAAISTAEPTPTPTPETPTSPTPSPDVQSSSEDQNDDQSSSSQPSTDTNTQTPAPQSLTVTSQLEQTSTPTPILTTDKPDYFPTEKVYISGTGFLPNTTYTIHITSSDSPFVSYRIEVTSDENGKISYIYQLDGNYRPNYSVEALDASGKIVASLSFTDDKDDKKTDPEPDKVTICHATDSQSNPYVTNEPDQNGDVSGHDGHNGGVWYPGIADHSWGDIIPPFTYEGGSYPGKNWTAEGRSIYDNGCNIPKPDLQVTKTNNASGEIDLGNSFTWTLSVTTSGQDVSFPNHFVILRDELPAGATYSSVSYLYSNLDNHDDISCSISDNVLTCVTNSNDVKLYADGYLKVSFTVTPTVSGTLSNPVSGGICSVDPENKVDESSSDNNSCSDSVIVNSLTGSISGYKMEDQDGDITTAGEGDRNPVEGWEISLWQETPDGWVKIADTVTDASGFYNFPDLLPGNYEVREGDSSNWTNLLPKIISLSINAGDNSTQNNFLNTTISDDKVTICHATGSDTNPFVRVTVSSSAVYHGHLGTDHQNGGDIIPAFTYQNSEYSQNWNILGQAIYRNNCSNGGNTEESDPAITIRKSNDASTDKTPGGSVTYRITINISEADVNNLVVKDLLPKGFVYRPGSYQVKINGLPVAIAEPAYHSPGTWNVGDVHEGDQIELTYIADISTDEQPGRYLDVVWAQGTSSSDNTVLAVADDESMVDTNFAGTTVNVVKDQTRVDSYNVEKKEVVNGQVLGASTSLPATGANELWLLTSLLSLGLGIKLVRSSK